jgi:hypothetical protein
VQLVSETSVSRSSRSPTWSVHKVTFGGAQCKKREVEGAPGVVVAAAASHKTRHVCFCVFSLVSQLLEIPGAQKKVCWGILINTATGRAHLAAGDMNGSSLQLEDASKWKPDIEEASWESEAAFKAALDLATAAVDELAKSMATQGAGETTAPSSGRELSSKEVERAALEMGWTVRNAMEEAHLQGNIAALNDRCQKAEAKAAAKVAELKLVRKLLDESRQSHDHGGSYTDKATPRSSESRRKKHARAPSRSSSSSESSSESEDSNEKLLKQFQRFEQFVQTTQRHEKTKKRHKHKK